MIVCEAAQESENEIMTFTYTDVDRIVGGQPGLGN